MGSLSIQLFPLTSLLARLRQSLVWNSENGTDADPFHTTEKYTFLDLPPVFHWALVPGAVRIWRRATLTARFVVVYFLPMILLYGMFDNLQGSRHRVQLDGIIALFQFYGVIGLLKQMLSPVRLPKAGKPASSLYGERS